jgi:hypothetical protein
MEAHIMNFTAPPEPRAYTINEFCRSHRVSRATLYKLWQLGTGPRFYLVGSHRRISNEAAAAWRAAGETAAQAQNTAA